MPDIEHNSPENQPGSDAEVIELFIPDSHAELAAAKRRHPAGRLNPDVSKEFEDKK